MNSNEWWPKYNFFFNVKYNIPENELFCDFSASNKGDFFLFRYSCDFGCFLFEFSIGLNFCYLDSGAVSWNGSRSGRPLWNGSEALIKKIDNVRIRSRGQDVERHTQQRRQRPLPRQEQLPNYSCAGFHHWSGFSFEDS